MTRKAAPDFYDDPVAWEWFDEIEDFKRDIREFGCASGFLDYWTHWDAWIFATAVAEDRVTNIMAGQQERSRGPGRRQRDRYWDKTNRKKASKLDKGNLRFTNQAMRPSKAQ